MQAEVRSHRTWCFWLNHKLGVGYSYRRDSKASCSNNHKVSGSIPSPCVAVPVANPTLPLMYQRPRLGVESARGVMIHSAHEVRQYTKMNFIL